MSAKGLIIIIFGCVVVILSIVISYFMYNDSSAPLTSTTTASPTQGIIPVPSNTTSTTSAQQTVASQDAVKAAQEAAARAAQEAAAKAAQEAAARAAQEAAARAAQEAAARAAQEAAARAAALSRTRTWSSFSGIDVPGSDIGCLTDGSDVSVCKARCDADPNCKSYVKVSSAQGGGWSKGGCCWKNNAISLEPNANVTLFTDSANFRNPAVLSFRKATQTDKGGSDIACYVDGSSPGRCMRECAQDPSCRGFNHVFDKQSWGGVSGCCLKNSVTAAAPARDIDLWL